MKQICYNAKFTFYGYVYDEVRMVLLLVLSRKIRSDECAHFFCDLEAKLSHRKAETLH